LSKNKFCEKNNASKGAMTYVGLKNTHVLEGKMGLSCFLKTTTRFSKEQGLSCSSWNNHVPKGGRVPFPKGHDCSLGEKKA